MQKVSIFSAVFPLMPWSQPPLPLHRVFAEGARQRQWSRSASSSSCSSQISDASSSSRSFQNTAGFEASMSERASSNTCFSQSADGSDVPMTDFEENAPRWSGADGMRAPRALADLSAAAPVSSLGSTMCSPRFSSDAAVCASLARAASAKSSSLKHTRDTESSAQLPLNK